MSQRMWGGRFSESPDAIMEEINASIVFDQRLFQEDIAGSIAHAQMLAKQNIITQNAAEKIISGLGEIQKEIEAGDFVFSRALEDIHMNVEAALLDKIGPVAGVLHTARSRNDQVATDFKLWVRKALDTVLVQLRALQRTLLERAEESVTLVMPGFTHLQPAQPVTLGHHFMAYVEMFGRDCSRIQDARRRLNECPLGAAALAGTSFPIDRFQTAHALGFDRPTANSLDSVADRDFAIEALALASLCMMHLSRLAEEIVLWCSTQFGFVSLSDRFTTGSSIMPQKKNPDACELVRAKTGRVYGALQALLTVMKGLPLAYSKDMQEDKEQVFDAFDSLLLAIKAMQGVATDLTPHPEKLAEAAGAGYTTATDLADWLVRVLSMPFRQAHHVTGQIVALANARGVSLEALSLSELQRIEPALTEDVFSVLSVQRSVESRTSYGGTAPPNVHQQIARWRHLLEQTAEEGSLV